MSIDPKFIEGMAEMVEGLGPVIEATKGYETKCREAGFRPEDAAAMAVEFHAALMAMLRVSLETAARAQAQK